MRIIVCGSRDLDSSWLMHDILDDVYEEYRFSILAHGDSRGADTLADGWAKARGLDVLKYRADWQTYGRAAGPVRNRKMLNIARPSLVVAFVTKPLRESIGTFDMVSIAEKASIPVQLYTFY